MNCHRGGFINCRHDKLRNFEANLLKQVCKDVQIEPMLQPTEGHRLGPSANTSNDARLDVRAKGFWRDSQNAYFDVRVTNTDSASQRNNTVTSILRKHEMEKKRAYNARVMAVEHATFTPLVYTIKGVMGKECSVYHKALAEKLATKSGDMYSEVTRLIRVKLSFIILKSALQCIRGSRTVYGEHLTTCDDFSHNLNEMRLN